MIYTTLNRITCEEGDARDSAWVAVEAARADAWVDASSVVQTEQFRKILTDTPTQQESIE
jgi:hypothetical protein